VQTIGDREARRMALFAQGLVGAREPIGVGGVLARLRAVQLDTIAVLARSHELVPHARLRRVSRAAIERAYWGSDSATFEYWSHGACVLPLEEWPAYRFQREARRRRGRRWHAMENTATSCAYVLDRLAADGPLTARELGGAKRGGPWWDWSETKIAAEWLLDVGDLVCRTRAGFQRVYDLAARAVPVALREMELSDAECARRLVTSAGVALGVATAADMAAYHGVPRQSVERIVGDTELVRVQVHGWSQPAYASEPALAALGRRARGRSLLLSPFDSLVWYRPRTARLFGFHHRLEAYVPRHKRVHGYFAMPVLGGDRFVGLVDPGRSGRTLVAKQVSLQASGAEPHVAAALIEAAGWVDCDDVIVERVDPPERSPALLHHLTARQ
jgi:uncharacterized protein YcaQ